MNLDHLRTARSIANLRQGRNDWYRITNRQAGPATVSIYDEIGFFGVTAADFIKDLEGVTGDIEVHLNCPGGNVFDGVAIYNALHGHSGDVAVVVDGLAASAASFIAQAARPGKLTIAKTASMMIHDAFGMGIGNATDLRKLADELDAQSGNIAGIYADRSGRPADHWRAAMQAETWYIGQEAVDAGLADQVGAAQRDEQLAMWDLSIFANYPGNQLPSEVREVANASYDDSPWDGNAAMSGCSSAADYRAICAGEHNAGSADERQHWALPHHKSPGAAPNRNGTNNALSQLPKTQDLANRQAAEDHLRAHARLWDGGDGTSDGWAEEFLMAMRRA